MYRSVALDLSGSALSWESFHDCLFLVQSYVLGAGYSQHSLFSDHTMRAVRDAVLNAGNFFVAADFDLWKEFCGSKLDSFVGRYTTLYSAFLAEKRKNFASHYDACTKANRMARVDQGSTSAASSSVVSESEKMTKNTSAERGSKFAEDSDCSSKRKSQVDLMAALDIGITSVKRKKKKTKDKVPGVFHRLKTSSTK